MYALAICAALVLGGSARADESVAPLGGLRDLSGEAVSEPWYQLAPVGDAIVVSDLGALLLVEFLDPDVPSGANVIVEIYSVDSIGQRVVRGAEYFFRPGQSVACEVWRHQLTGFDGISLRLRSDALIELDARNDPRLLETPAVVDVAIYNPRGPLARSRGPLTHSVPSDTQYASSAPPYLGSRPNSAPARKKVGITGQVDGVFITYCCPKLVSDPDRTAGDDKEPAPVPPKQKPAGNAKGCTVVYTSASTQESVTVALKPGDCTTLSGLSTESSSAHYYYAK